MSAPGLEGLALPGVDDDANRGVGVKLRHASANSSRMALFMALSRSGRLLISQPTGPWRSSFKVSNTGGRPLSCDGDVIVPGRLSPDGEAHSRLTLLGEGQRSLGLVGMAPHGDQLGGTRLAGVGEALFEGPPERPLGGRHGRRGVAGDLLGQGLGLLTQAFGRIDHLADHAQRQGAIGRHALVPPHQGHAQDRLEGHATGQADQLVGRHLAHRDVRVEEGGTRTRP